MSRRKHLKKIFVDHLLSILLFYYRTSCFLETLDDVMKTKLLFLFFNYTKCVLSTVHFPEFCEKHLLKPK